MRRRLDRATGLACVSYCCYHRCRRIWNAPQSSYFCGLIGCRAVAGEAVFETSFRLLRRLLWHARIRFQKTLTFKRCLAVSDLPYKRRTLCEAHLTFAYFILLLSCSFLKFEFCREHFQFKRAFCCVDESVASFRTWESRLHLPPCWCLLPASCRHALD